MKTKIASLLYDIYYDSTIQTMSMKATALILNDTCMARRPGIT